MLFPNQSLGLIYYICTSSFPSCRHGSSNIRERKRVCFRSAILTFMKTFNNVFILSNTVHYTYRQNLNSRRGSDLADNRGQYINLLFREDILDAILKMIYLQWSNCGRVLVCYQAHFILLVLMIQNKFAFLPFTDN